MESVPLHTSRRAAPSPPVYCCYYPRVTICSMLTCEEYRSNSRRMQQLRRVGVVYPRGQMRHAGRSRIHPTLDIQGRKVASIRRLTSPELHACKATLMARLHFWLTPLGVSRDHGCLSSVWSAVYSAVRCSEDGAESAQVIANVSDQCLTRRFLDALSCTCQIQRHSPDSRLRTYEGIEST